MLFMCVGNGGSQIANPGVGGYPGWIQGNHSLIRFLLSAISLRSVPILVTGEDGFPFHEFFRQGRISGLTISAMGKLLVANSVNMYHLRDIIENMREWINRGSFPVFSNLSRQYLDENLAPKVSEQIFLQDQERLEGLLQSSNPILQPIFLWESHWEDPHSRRGFFQKEIYRRARVVIDWRNESIQVVKNLLTERERGMLYGSSDSGIFHLGGRLIQGMERIPEFSTERRPSFF